MNPRYITISACLAAVLALAACKREMRPVKAPAAASGVADPSYAASGVTPVSNRDEENAYAVSQGKSWYKAYNCNGCHGGGGAAISVRR